MCIDINCIDYCFYSKILENIKILKKVLLFLTIFLIPTLALVFASGYELRSKKSAFVLYDGKSIKIKSGMKIEDPENKIIVIYNHGGWGYAKNNTEFKYCKGSTVAGVLGKMSGTKVKGKEIVL